MRVLASIDAEGRIIPRNRERFMRRAGKDVYIEVHDQPAPGLRSLDANRYYFGVVIRAICAETGNDPLTVHWAMKREAVRLGVLDPEYVCIGDQLIEAEPTTVTDSETFSRYVSWVVDFAREKLGVHVEEAS